MSGSFLRVRGVQGVVRGGEGYLYGHEAGRIFLWFRVLSGWARALVKAAAAAHRRRIRTEGGKTGKSAIILIHWGLSTNF